MAPAESIIVNRNNLSPPSNGERPMMVSLIRGMLTIAMMRAAPMNRLVTLAVENVIFLNIESLISGLETLTSRNTKKVKKSKQR